jgi:phage tail protein X
VTVSFTLLPAANGALHVGLQLIPAGLLVTVPEPEPVPATVTVSV